jgi:hypothetical protein
MRCVGETAFARPRLREHFRKFILAPIALLAWSCFATVSWADNTPAPNQVFYFEMRAPVVDPAPRYAAASPVPVDGKSIAVAACDGNTYFLSLVDGAAVQAAIANASIVQLQIATLGDAPSTSRTICILQTGN